jgi:PAS domain S-box-containing protein
MVLQGAVALTFGLAFLGLWKGFRRRTALSWGIAWLVYSVGVVFSAAGIGLGPGMTRPSFLPVILPLPLIWGVLLFRSGTDALVDQDRASGPARYVAACAMAFAIVLGSRVGAYLWWPTLHPAVLPFIEPRLLMAIGYAWVAWPLRRLPKRRRREGGGLLIGVLALLSLRMVGTVVYEVLQIARGAAQQPENVALTVLQLSLLIVFGVGTAVVLIEAEHAEAVRAANTIRETAEALGVSEARFRFVVENSSDVQVLVDAHRRVLYVAPSCERLIGFPPEALEGRDFLEVLHPDDIGDAVAAFRRMQSDPTGRRPPTSVRIQHLSGEWLPFDVSGQLVPQPSAGGPAIVLSVRDMTAQRRLEAALQQTGRLDSLGRMAGSVAHDFNNTLTAIMGARELAQEELPAGSAALPYLAMIEQAAKRADLLTRQLLTFARQLPATSQRIDVGAHLTALEGMVAIAVGRGVVLQVVAESGAYPVRVDPSQFDQAILNLAINARDAMRDGGTLTIRTGPAPERDGGSGRRAHVRIAVEDTGTGIPRAVLDRIFEPFFTTKESGRGTGLGLASVYGFVRQAGGDITVETAEGKGSRFLIDLPLAPAEPLETPSDLPVG